MSVAIISHTTLSIFRWRINTKLREPPSLQAQTNIDNNSHPTSVDRSEFYNQQVIFLDAERILVHRSCLEGSVISAFRYQAQDINFVKDFKTPPIQQILVQKTTRGVKAYRQSFDDQIIEDFALANWTSEEIAVSKLAIVKFPTRVERIEIVDVPGQEFRAVSQLPCDPSTDTIVFGLASNGSLFANDRRLVQDCTSFLLTPAHLIFTTTQHLLKFVHVTTIQG